MTVINRQKFLAELSKLLTFMYDEDRQMALDLYAQMFDGAESEQVLLQFFGSPTKQAVMVARSYQANAQGPATEEDEVPEFVHTILTIEDEARERQILFPEENKDQFSLFADEGPEAEEEPVPAARPQTAELVKAPDLPEETGTDEEAEEAAVEEPLPEEFIFPSAEDGEKDETEAIDTIQAEAEEEAEVREEEAEEEEYLKNEEEIARERIVYSEFKKNENIQFNY